MWNKTSTPIVPFGNVNPKEGQKGRPGYYINKEKYFYCGSEIQKLPNEDEFQKLRYGYAKTNKRVLYEGKTIHGAETNFIVVNRKNKFNLPNDESLKVLDSVLGMDSYEGKQRFYSKGVLIKPI